MARIENACKRCARTRAEVRLQKCIVCLDPFCRACAYLRHGKPFCSRACAEVFFFGDEDS